ncbi:MAG: hypothetical protein K5650_07285 [Bacteroidales bacterium]|nr:hypothetical protein [Bacteroidales bacterium]
MSNQKKYDELRRKYHQMTYESYNYSVTADGLRMEFALRLDGTTIFRPTALVESRSFLTFDLPHKVLDTLIFNIGMIELISYWKACCPPVVRVECGHLSDDARRFWLKTYRNGLGEFFYTNGIEGYEDDFMTLEAPESDDDELLTDLVLNPGYIVPIGGGKDSVVTLEALGHDERPLPLIMNPRGATVGCVSAAGYTMNDVAVIKRTIDPLLLEMNAQGCLNGHTPFSAMLAFYTLLVSACSGRDNIALSNESSANEATVVGTEVNHQYSKSLEFEDDFRRYVQDNIGGGFNYFSFLRPLSELQIAMLFSGLPKYHDVFRSCNAGSKQDIWCGRCAKCLFAYIILSPFIEPIRLNAIFGKSMLDDTTLAPIFDQLTGRAPTKPFECVGTVSEVNSAINMAIKRWYTGQRPALVANWQLQPSQTDLASLQPRHNLNSHELNILRQCIEKNS